MIMTEPWRVEIWRYNHRTLTIARTDGATWNAPDSIFRNKVHEGIWNSRYMCFQNEANGYFSDGTPVSIYEGLDTVEDT